jgi:hypothetical protein
LIHHINTTKKNLLWERLQPRYSAQPSHSSQLKPLLQKVVILAQAGIYRREAYPATAAMDLESTPG